MTTPEPRPTSYIPQGYRHRQSKALGFGIFTGIAAAVLGVMDWRGGGPPWWVQGMIVGVPGALALTAFLLRWGDECRVEGESLWLASQSSRPINIAIDEIIAIDRIDWAKESWFEMVVRDKGRIKVPRTMFEPIEPLREALRAVNPGIRFGSHSAAHCRNCGAELFRAGEVPNIPKAMRFIVNAKCPACDRRLPKFGQFVP